MPKANNKATRRIFMVDVLSPLEAYLVSFQASTMELFKRKGFYQLTIFAKKTPSEILDEFLNAPLSSAKKLRTASLNLFTPVNYNLVAIT